MKPDRLEELRQMAAAVDGPKSAWMDELIVEVDRLKSEILCGGIGSLAEKERMLKERDALRAEVEDLKGHFHRMADIAVRLDEKLRLSNLQNDGLRKVVEGALTEIGGWREVIAEWDDMGKTEALAKAMCAALDQIDRWRKSARELLSGSEKRKDEAPPGGAHNHRCLDCKKVWGCEDELCRLMIAKECRDCGRNSY